MALTTAQRLKIARSEAGLTQPQLSKLTGIAQANISRYETGGLKPTAATVDTIIAAIETHLGKPIQTLDAVDGVLGIVGRTAGKLMPVDLMATPRKIEWIVEQFLARRFVTMVAGQPGAGKSSISQTLAVALASGKDEAAGMRLHGQPTRILITDAENIMHSGDEDAAPDASLVQDRLQQYGLTPDTAANVVAVGSAGFDLDKDSAALDALLADYAKAGEAFDVVILDSFTSLWFGNENVVENVQSVLVKLNRIAVKHNVAILLIHHADKAGESYRGSTAIAATIAAVFTFARLDDDNAGHPGRVLACVKMRIAPEPGPLFVRTSATGILPMNESE